MATWVTPAGTCQAEDAGFENVQRVSVPMTTQLGSTAATEGDNIATGVSAPAHKTVAAPRLRRRRAAFIQFPLPRPGLNRRSDGGSHSPGNSAQSPHDVSEKSFRLTIPTQPESDQDAPK